MIFHEKFENGMEEIEKSKLRDPEKTDELDEGNPYEDAFLLKFNQEAENRRKAAEQEGRKENTDSEAKGKENIGIEGKIKELPQQELSSDDKSSFQKENYRTVETTEDITLYRVYGEGAGKQGRFLTTERPTDRMSVKDTLALPTKIEGEERWTNSRQYYCEVKIPKGTVLNIGKIETQETTGGETLQGGADQVLVSYDFVKENPANFGEEHVLKFAGNYHAFEEKADQIELASREKVKE